MFNKLNSLLKLSVVAVILSSCSSSKNTSSDNNEIDMNPISEELIIVPDTFVLPDMPDELIDSDARAKYLVAHYWDNFDFTNEALIDIPEITEQAFVDYINILYYVTLDEAKVSLVSTIQNAEINKSMYRHFASLFNKYFYEPNSPFRNEEFYIPVLEQVCNSSLLEEEDKSRYSFQLQMTKINRVGYQANDFTYTLQSGESFKLNSIKSEYTIVMFSNPECSTCITITNALAKSDVINNALSMNSSSRTMLTILTVFPDAEIDEWKQQVSSLPTNWVHSYDQGMTITRQKLYDIKALPTLYLLDKSKKVILKDTSLETLESFFELPDR